MNKRFRKALSCIMACIMALTAMVPVTAVFADDSGGHQGFDDCVLEAYEIPMKGDYKGIPVPQIESEDRIDIEHEVTDKSGQASDATIYVEAEWTSMYFKYDFGKAIKYNWNTDNLTYEPVIKYKSPENKPDWETHEATLSFKNFSNREMYVRTAFEANDVECYKDVTVKGSNEFITLASAVGLSQTEIEPGVATYTVSGEPDREFEYDKDNVPDIGTVSFLISDNIAILSHTCDFSIEGEDSYTTYCSVCGRQKITRLPDDGHKHEYHSLDDADSEFLATLSDEQIEDGCRYCIYCGKIENHNYTYNQFGFLVCTVCGRFEHTVCIDANEDGMCDKCGVERDFCPDCYCDPCQCDL